jgi:dUTP pyrophosphatase
MDTNDSNVRVPADGTYGHGNSNVRPVQFVGEVGRAPRAHVPGTPVERVDGTLMPILSQPYDWTKPNNPPRVRIKLLMPGAKVPQLGTELAAGYDLYAPIGCRLEPGDRRAVPLGFAMALPPHLHGRIESRSGLALKGLVVLTGVIDADYRGEVKVIMQNLSDQVHEFVAGDRVAQLVLRPTVHVPWEAVPALEDTARGGGGFGSTGA